MASFYEVLALNVFAMQVGVELIRKDMKRAAIRAIDPTGALGKDDQLIDAIASLPRIPDAMAVLTPEHAERLGLRKKHTIVFCEAEHTSPIPPVALQHYAEIYDVSEDGYDCTIAVAVIERYGRWHFLDLGAIYVASCYAMNDQGTPNEA
jgi:hypothetical protein